MASKVTPLYAETRTLLNLWALDETPATKSKFLPGKAYSPALVRLVEGGALTREKKGRYVVYSLAEAGESKLASGLQDESFVFSTSIGPKTTNAILRWFREDSAEKDFAAAAPNENGKADSSSSHNSNRHNNKHNGNGHKSKSKDGNGHAADTIDSYELFEKKTLATYDRLNQDYNLDNLVPIYRIRRELGDRLPRQKFNEWLLEVQSNDLVQLMASNQAQVTSDQMEDSITIPGAGTRFFMKRLK